MISSRYFHSMPFTRTTDSEFRRKGLAYEALQLLISYATDSEDSAANYPKRPPQLPIPRSSLVVRVSQFNTPSIQLFERMGMRIVKRVEVFQEVEMRPIECVLSLPESEQSVDRI